MKRIFRSHNRLFESLPIFSGNARNWIIGNSKLNQSDLCLNGSIPVVSQSIRGASNICARSYPKKGKAEIPSKITIEVLAGQLEQFQMASVRDADELQAIRNTAYYARPASSVDTSKFVVSSQELFEYKAHQFG